MNVMVVAHAHPALSAGGGERAAYSLFEHLKARDGIEATFVAHADPRDIGHDGWFGSFRGRPDEILLETPDYDWLRRAGLKPDVMRLQFRALVERFRPDVTHFHHVIFFGVEALGMAREESRGRVVLTLHEYALICHHDGQMVKTGSYKPCEIASPAECHRCFPAVPSGQFFARAHMVREYLRDVDAIVSPSRFLKDRHVTWGLPADRIHVIENALPPAFDPGAASHVAAAPPVTAGGDDATGPRLRLGFFGTLNRYKGATVLLEALTHLPRALAERVDVVLFGAKLGEQPEEFQAGIRAAIAASPANVTLFGPYPHENVAALMRSVDWVVIPSTWWENSPLVIQEARAAGRPVLASNIGGMAEKVRDGVDGRHFLAGNPVDLAAKIEDIVTGRLEVHPPPCDIARQNRDAVDAHLRLYRGGIPSPGF